MSEELFSKEIMVKYLKQALDTQIEVCKEFIASEDKPNPNDEYELSVLEVLRRNIDSISTDKVPLNLLCLKCGAEVTQRKAGR